MLRSLGDPRRKPVSVSGQRTHPDRPPHRIFQQQRSRDASIRNKRHILFPHAPLTFGDRKYIIMYIPTDGKTLFRRIWRELNGPVDIRDGIEAGRSGIIDPADIIAIYGERAALGHIIVVVVVPGPAPAKSLILRVVVRNIDGFVNML